MLCDRQRRWTKCCEAAGGNFPKRMSYRRLQQISGMNYLLYFGVGQAPRRLHWESRKGVVRSRGAMAVKAMLWTVEQPPA